MNRGPYVLQPDGTYRDPAKPDEWKLSVEMIKLLHDAGWVSPYGNDIALSTVWDNVTDPVLLDIDRRLCALEQK